MATIFEDKIRNIIPRWRDFNTTVAIGELKSSRQIVLPVNHPQGDFLASKLKDWKNNKTIAFAAEVVGEAFVLGRQNEAVEVAKFIIEQKEGVSESLKAISLKILNPDVENEVESLIDDADSVETSYLYKRIHNLRNQLREEPRNSIVYVDLARAYTLLDENEKALQAINLALKLSPNNRFILRSAARLMLHTKDYNQAHKILRQAEITRYDSWLLAAEISVASAVNNPVRFAKTGQKLLAENKLSPLEITELATALAMLEIEYGKSRDARKLIQQAIISPTENSLAQIEWAARNRIKLDFVNLDNFENVPLVHEAKAWEHYSNGEWKKALNESWKWFYDQPFSDRPVNLGSYLASTIIGDYQEGIKILEKGKISNPNDFTVLNNLAFCYASLNDIANARKAFDEISLVGLDDKTKIVAAATEGLIAFRSGDFSKGRAKYREAITNAEKHNLPELLARAKVYYAREEIRAKTPEADKVKMNTIKESEEINSLEIQIIVDRELKQKEEPNKEAT